jgi:polyphenol oxidase
MKFELKRMGDWSYYYVPEIEEAGIVHGFFTAESPLPVLEGQERNAFLQAFHLKDLIVMRQEHGDKVHIVNNGDKPGSGDGLVLVNKGVAGIIKTADCLPIIVADPDYPMASVVHAGWRGTVRKITRKAVRTMADLGAKKGRMVALLGPAINACCYRVGEEVHREFKDAGFSEGIFSRNRDSLFLSLRQANKEILAREGVLTIGDADLCTFCTADLFYSFRRGEKEKRQINFVSLAE